jgi:hypothetical protein
MSQFYDLASLVVIPSGYKASTIYAQKPLATDGQLSFSRASTATRVNASGLIEAVASNVPRLDYLGSTCPRLLLEPQRSNSALYSEQFNNAYWLNSGLSLSVNSATSPDGYVNADIATETATTSQHGLSSGVISFTSGTTYTFSAFAKNAPSGRGFIQLYGFQLGAAAANVFANFNLNTGVVGTATGGTSAITNYGNGWYRCTFTFTCGNSLSERINLFNVTSASATAGQSYAGDITKAIYWYGAQVEVGAYATSYIPTTTAAVTRVAEFTKKTGISSLIGSTEGVLYAEVDYKTTNESGTVLLDVNDNDLTNRVIIFFGAGVIGAFIQGSTIISYIVPSFGTYKIAFGYKSGNFVLYVNGVQRGTSSASVTFSGMNQLFLGQTFDINNSQPVNGIKQALLFKTRLTNAQLAELTTL